jgi:putative ABC transport system substrate-binding protein
MLSELLAAKSEVIVVVGNTIAQMAKAATSTVPIVMATSADPEATGLVASLSRPGGNITGLSAVSAGLTAKRLQLLREILPGASRVTLLLDPRVPGAAYAFALRETEDAARADPSSNHLVYFDGPTNTTFRRANELASWAHGELLHPTSR